MKCICGREKRKYQSIFRRLFATGLTLLALFGILLRVLAQDNFADIATQANLRYGQGDYTGAISLYESLTAAGIRDSAIYFNLGNAYFQAQNLGMALLNYRRAQILTPRDRELNVNIARVRAERVDIQGDETALVDSLASLTNSVLTINELGWVTFFSWALFLGILALWVMREQWREVLRGPLLGAGILMISAGLIFGCRVYVDSNRPVALVVHDVAVMSGPGNDYLEIYRLYSAAEVRVLEQRDDWVRFILPDQRQGWVQKIAMEIV